MESNLQRNALAQTRAAPGALGAILYISKAARPVSHSDLTHLLEQARQRNQQQGITGVLLYSEGSFMQYLEGPSDALLRVYAIIKTDPLHFGLIDLVREPISVRAFSEWSMACHWVGASGASPLSDDYDLLASRMAVAVSEKSAARRLLARFWTLGRQAVAPALTAHSQSRLQRRQVLEVDGGTSD